MSGHANPSYYIAPPYPDTQDAACRDVEPELFFPLGAHERDQAIAVCQRCPIQQECLDYAVPQVLLAGIWGGTTEEQRRALRWQRCSGCGRRGRGPCADQETCDEARAKRMGDE